MNRLASGSPQQPSAVKKRAYRKPQLVKFGPVSQLTRGGTCSVPNDGTGSAPTICTPGTMSMN